ncbi:restriction endonuclease subunit S [Tepidimonas charontis]|uniref:restriction endonuclease subunit S n=1 Tax=Tepidimonas charontis TaxID=2267262 RepID=UPI001185BA3B|nr:type I restriction endonuclease subunit S [Tepidimonas charontis]
MSLLSHPGSQVGRFCRPSLAHFQVVAPPGQIAEAFGRAVKPKFARSSAAIRESRTLAALRDTLLPKLISGELRVRDAETFLERVMP